MSDLTVGAEAPRFHDRRGWLIALGNVLILFGVLNLINVVWSLFSALMYVAMGMGQGEMGRDAWFATAYMLVGAASGLAMAVMDIWLGVGSILCRRWAQKLIEVGSWVYVGVILYFYIILTFAMVEIRPLVQRIDEEGIFHIVLVVTAIIMAIVGLLTLAPAALYGWFYGTENVRLTCRWRDPKPRWTDPVPGMVLATGIYLVFLMLYMPLLAIVDVFPYGPYVLRGGAAAGMWAVCLMAGLYVVWGLVRLQRAAWILAVVMTLGIGAPVTYGVLVLPVGPLMEEYMENYLMPGYDDPLEPEAYEPVPEPPPEETEPEASAPGETAEGEHAIVIDDTASDVLSLEELDRKMDDFVQSLGPLVSQLLGLAIGGAMVALAVMLAFIAPHYFRAADSRETA